MAVISLNGIKFFSYHGFYEEETILGGEYIIDISVEVDVNQASAEDDLHKSVNYETLFYLCKVEMKKPSKLIEAVAQRIIYRIYNQFENVEGIYLKLYKLNPPLDGTVGFAAIELKEGTFADQSLYE